MTPPERDTLAIGLLLLAVCLLALLAGCVTCQAPGLTRCGAVGPEVCAGGYWREIRDCREVSSADNVRWTCEQPEGEIAACMPSEGSP